MQRGRYSTSLGAAVVVAVLSSLGPGWGCSSRHASVTPEPDGRGTGSTLDSGDGGELDSGRPPADPEITLGRADRDKTNFRPYGDEPELDLVHGSQGGWHVWPHIRLTGVPWEKEQIKTRLEAVIFDRSSGEELTKETKYTVRHYAWKPVGEGYVHKMLPVIFDIDSPDEVVGREVRVEVELKLIGDGSASASTDAVIVDPDGK